ncbi:MAG: hypothetical protein R3C18_27950 [Planctomycetaceae bacterium]
MTNKSGSHIMRPEASMKSRQPPSSQAGINSGGGGCSVDAPQKNERLHPRKMKVQPLHTVVTSTLSIAPDSKKRKPKSEAETTKALSWFLFSGQGCKYLGFRFADRELQDDGTWKVLSRRYDADLKRWVANYDHPEHWTTDKSHNHWRCSALLQHLQGQHRGLVVTEDSGCTHVPFIASDLDRHHDEDRYQHLQRVIKVGRLCAKLFPHLRWLVEVNHHNGSVKFFGFGRKAIPIATAREMAEQLHQAVVQITGNESTEVFPHNLQQVMLPFRTDKTTIISTGELSKVERHRNKPVRQKYTTYSMCEFEQWWLGSDQYDELALRKVLKKVLQLENWDVNSRIEDAVISKPVNRLDELRDEAYREAIGLDVPQPALSSLRSEKGGPLGRTTNCGLGPDGGVLPSSVDEIKGEPDTFTRRRLFTQWLSRQQRHVPTPEEVHAEYVRLGVSHGSATISDFRPICRYVARGFEADKLGNGKSQMPDLMEKFYKWKGRATTGCVLGRKFRTQIGQQLKANGYLSNGRTRIVDGNHLPYVMAIVEQVRKPDGGIPRVCIEGWWHDLHRLGCLPEWNKEYWTACRKVLVQLGWIKAYHNYSKREHLAKTCRIIYGNGPLVGTLYSYPTESTTIVPPPPIKVVAQSDTPFEGDMATRPPPDPPPPPLVRFTPSFAEQISWN